MARFPKGLSIWDRRKVGDPYTSVSRVLSKTKQSEFLQKLRRRDINFEDSAQHNSLNNFVSFTLIIDISVILAQEFCVQDTSWVYVPSKEDATGTMLQNMIKHYMQYALE